MGVTRSGRLAVDGRAGSGAYSCRVGGTPVDGREDPLSEVPISGECISDGLKEVFKPVVLMPPGTTDATRPSGVSGSEWR